MTYYYNLYYGEKLVFIHTHYNACIGQAKYFYNRKNMNQKDFYIIDTQSNKKYDINESILRGE